MTNKDAIIVDHVIKRFRTEGQTLASMLDLWHKVTGQKPASNGNGGETQNGHETVNATKAPNGRKKITVALNDVSFSVKEGEVFGVLGPNGSGKSTLIRLLSTLLLPDEGRLTVFGFDPVTEPLKVQSLINRVSVEASFFKKLSPMENLMFGARLYGMGGRESSQKSLKILKRLGLEDHNIYNPMEQMSRGMQQKVAIARALLTTPRVLLLDEPTTGLDPVSKREVQAVVREMVADGVTILLTTHDMVEADKLCNRVAIIHNGVIVALDTPEELKKLAPGENGAATTLEDVFIHLTGRELVKEEEMVVVE
jgi:ABC-2 type transport system ATP-binding protein